MQKKKLTAKWSYVTRTLPGQTDYSTGRATDSWRSGDLVVARVTGCGAHEHLEDPHGRRAKLYDGDLVVGALGNRYATDFYEGYVPSGAQAHLLTAGGLIGTVASADVRRDPPTELEILGPLTVAGRNVHLDDHARPVPAHAMPSAGTVVVVGSSMNAGKTTTATSIVRGWRRAGVSVGAGKATGSGSGKDRWAYLDAGAAAVLDFLDFGMPSTFGYPMDRLSSTMEHIRDGLVAEGAEAVVIEIADGLLQDETKALLPAVRELADGVVLAVGDAMGAAYGTQLLKEAELPLLAISGRITMSPLASQEAAAVTGVPVLDVAELAAGALVPLMTHGRAEPA